MSTGICALDISGLCIYICPMRTRTDRIIWELGGTKAVADQFGLHPNTVNLWKRNDRIPSMWQGQILEWAKRVNARVTAEDLIG